jgi:hypothetical protein
VDHSAIAAIAGDGDRHSDSDTADLHPDPGAGAVEEHVGGTTATASTAASTSTGCPEGPAEARNQAVSGQPTVGTEGNS